MRANSDTGILGARRLVVTFRGLGLAMAGVSTFWSRRGVIDGMAITRSVRGAGCSDDEEALGASRGVSAHPTCGLGLKRASAALRALFTCPRSSSGQMLPPGELLSQRL